MIFFLLLGLVNAQKPGCEHVACSMIYCGPDMVPSLIPGTEGNCCKGTYECRPVTPKCSTGMIPCTKELQARGMNCVVGQCIRDPAPPRTCCKAFSAECLACAGGLTVEEFCKQNPQTADCATRTPIGGSQDTHGCTASGGYKWCEALGKCARSWEEKSFDADGDGVVSPDEFDQGCSRSRTMVGRSRDAHGCIASAGYKWCEALGKCARSWEEKSLDVDGDGVVSPDEFAQGCSGTRTPVGGSQDTHGCVKSGGYSWCETLGKCARPWEEKSLDLDGDGVVSPEEFSTGCSKAPLGGVDANGCVAGGGYQWCAKLGKCVRPWEELSLDANGDGFVSADEFAEGCKIAGKLGNPASINCEKQGGTVVFDKDSNGGVMGICQFPDGSQCEEWALMRGECTKASAVLIVPVATQNNNKIIAAGVLCGAALVIAGAVIVYKSRRSKKVVEETPQN